MDVEQPRGGGGGGKKKRRRRKPKQCAADRWLANWREVLPSVRPVLLWDEIIGLGLDEERRKAVLSKMTGVVLASLERRTRTLWARRLRLERRIVRQVVAAHKKWGGELGRHTDLVCFGKPDRHQWIVPGRRAFLLAKQRGEDVKRRYLGRASVRLIHRMRLQSLFHFVVRHVPRAYGVLVVAPHEGYTTNTCLFCGRYSKYAKFVDRHRVCRTPNCPGGVVWLERDYASGLNQPIAARLQVDYLARCNGL